MQNVHLYYHYHPLLWISPMCQYCEGLINIKEHWFHAPILLKPPMVCYETCHSCRKRESITDVCICWYTELYILDPHRQRLIKQLSTKIECIQYIKFQKHYFWILNNSVDVYKRQRRRFEFAWYEQSYLVPFEITGVLWSILLYNPCQTGLRNAT